MTEFVQIVYGLGTLVLLGLFVHGMSPLRRYLRTRRRPAVVGAVIAVAWLSIPVIVPLPDEPSPAPAAQSRTADTLAREPSTATTTPPSRTAHTAHTPAKTRSAVAHTPPTSKNRLAHHARLTPYLVTEVVDGDTVHVAFQGVDETIRLLGIDTPETKDPRKGVGCFGQQASAWATRKLEGRRVGVRTDPTQDRRDRYGRLLAYLRLPSGEDYSVKAARLGYAKYYLYDVPVSKASQIQSAERSARAAGRGLWGSPCHGRTDAGPKTNTAASPDYGSPKPLVTGVPKGSVQSYANCAAVRAAGVAPLHRGQTGYSRQLDRDGDGLACE